MITNYIEKWVVDWATKNIFWRYLPSLLICLMIFLVSYSDGIKEFPPDNKILMFVAILPFLCAIALRIFAFIVYILAEKYFRKYFLDRIKNFKNFTIAILVHFSFCFLIPLIVFLATDTVEFNIFGMFSNIKVYVLFFILPNMVASLAYLCFAYIKSPI